jgi:hypothetical protein
MFLSDLPEAFLQTVVHQIALLLLRGAGGDLKAAQLAAQQTINAYNPRTEAEFRLAACVISFGLQSLEALAQAADPDLPLLRAIRLRSGAVSLAREAHKAERQLERLQADRVPGSEPAPAETAPQPEPPKMENATAPVQGNRPVAAYAKAHGLTWTQALREREREKRLAERQRKQQERARKDGSIPASAAA